VRENQPKGTTTRAVGPLEAYPHDRRGQRLRWLLALSTLAGCRIPDRASSARRQGQYHLIRRKEERTARALGLEADVGVRLSTVGEERQWQPIDSQVGRCRRRAGRRE
jgi:hypothetical protein